MNLWLSTNKKIYSSLDNKTNHFLFKFNANHQLSQNSQKRPSPNEPSLDEDQPKEKANKKLYFIESKKFTMKNRIKN